MIQRLRQYLGKYAFMARATRIFENLEISWAIDLAVFAFLVKAFFS
ncbi:hypothetical protein T11_10902 [Trichinella zimbabwensis]|uniref:Uncharacterized protein n=1 Tax=Trichinella zimbabwensis TaxID=268475 RepID=A0A0V1GJI2_9BILA|nr:hypothetical protein T11_11830 [Trichinella zimbabwensis]KRY98316.1 hypothetical protein T11_10902 [Trichinella zimbabwensis]